ncbi:hypothetical protein ACFLX9_03270, partial [Chloroflexota bacterium]
MANLPNIIGSSLWMLSHRWSYLNQFAGSNGWVWRMSHQGRGNIMIGNTLTISGRLTGKERRDGNGLVEVDAPFLNQNGATTIPRRAKVALLLKGGPAVSYSFA